MTRPAPLANDADPAEQVADGSSGGAAPTTAWWTVVVPVVVAAALWVPGIGAGSIINGDDALYAVTVRGLVEGDGGWLRALGWRPPLYFAFASASAASLGLGELGLRLPGLVFAVAAVGATAALGARLFSSLGHAAAQRVGVLAGLALALSAQLAIFARTVRGIDALFMLLAIAAVFVAVRARSTTQWALAGGLAGLAFLAKSVVVATLVAPMAWLVVTAPGPLRDRARCAAAAVAATASVGATWTIALAVWSPGGLRDHVDNHVVRRATGGALVGESHGPGYYLEQLFTFEGFVWMLALAGAAGLLAARRLPLRERALPALWAAWTIGLFSAATTKLPHYLLPSYPALTIAGAGALVVTAARLRPALQLAAGAALVVASVLTAPAQVWTTLGSADFAPGDRDAAMQAREFTGADGTLLVWSHYHVGASFYFGGRSRMLSDNPGMLGVYRRTHGFAEGTHFDEVSLDEVGAALHAAAPACLWVPAPRDTPAVVQRVEASLASVAPGARRIHVLSGAMWCVSATVPPR